MSSVLPCCVPVENDARSTPQTWGLSDWPNSGIAQISITVKALNSTFVHQKEQACSVIQQTMVVLL